MIESIVEFDSQVCFDIRVLKHFDNIIIDLLNQFVTTLPTSFDYDVGMYYQDFKPYSENQKPQIFIRSQFVENLSNLDNCCKNQYPYFVIHFTTNFENQKYILQDIVNLFQSWLLKSGQEVNFLYTFGGKNYNYKTWLGNNLNKMLDITYNPEKIKDYNYHTYTTQIILNIYAIATF